MRKRGFTLLETMMVLLILSVFSVMALQSLNRGRHKAGAEGLASILSEELKRTRQEAIARRRPTALILPTNNGRASATRSFYIMEGETIPRIVRSRNYSSEFGGADIFMGRWPLAAGAWRTTTLSVPGSKWSQFRVDSWLPSSASALNDYCFVFLPDGTVQTNDLLSLDNRYHLVVAAGASYPAGASNATLTGTGEAYTVSISPIGGVSLSRGIYAASSSLASVGQHSTLISHQAPQATPVAKETPVPLAQMPDILPSPNPNTLPDTDPPDALITKDQYVSLDMQAKSTSGEQLYCRWEVQGPNNKEGAFSIQSQGTGNGAGGRMEWDQGLNNGVGAWRANWQWRPPPNALPGERYTLTCLVQNIGSGEGKIEIKRFEIRPPGKILFQSDRRPGHIDIFTMDESGQRERLYLPDAKQPSATLDGRRMVFVSNLTNNLYLHCPLDPSNDIQLTNSGDCRFPAISPSGNLVAFFRGNDLKVMRVAAVGNGLTPSPTQVGVGTIDIDNEALHEDIYKVAWTRDGRHLIYGDGNLLKKTPVDDSGGAPSVGTPATISTGTYKVSSATDTFDGNGIIYVDNYSAGAGYDPWVKRDSSNQRLYLSVNYEDGSVERNPRGENEFMITRGPAVPQGNRQLRVVHITGVQAATVGPALTSAGNNTRPVWTQ